MKTARLVLAAVLLTLVATAGTAGADPAPTPTAPSTVAGAPCGPAAGPACGKVVPPSSLNGPTTLGGAVGSGIDSAEHAAGDIITAPFRAMASAFADAYGDLLKQMLAAWVAVPTPSIDPSPSGAAGFVDSSVQFLVLWTAVLGLLVTAARLIWQRKADPAKDMAAGLGRLIVVTGCGIVGINLALQAGDAFSNWILARAVGRGDPTAQLATLGTASLSAITSPGLLFVLGVIGLVGCIIQIALLVVRSALLPILAGLFPLSAAASITPMGSAWFRKTCGWLLALVLFKPASAIVYAVAIKLFTSPKTPLSAVQGVVLIFMATFTLPALMKFIVPAVAAIGTVSTAEVAAAGVAVATGAIVLANSGGTSAVAMGAAGTGSPPRESGPPGADTPSGGAGPAGAVEAGDTGSSPRPGGGEPGSAGGSPPGAAPVTDPAGTTTGSVASRSGGGGNTGGAATKRSADGSQAMAMARIGTTASGALRSMERTVEGVADGAEEIR